MGQHTGPYWVVILFYMPFAGVMHLASFTWRLGSRSKKNIHMSDTSALLCMASLSTWLAWASSQHGSLRVARPLTWQLFLSRTKLKGLKSLRPSLRRHTVLLPGILYVKASLGVRLDSKKKEIESASWWRRGKEFASILTHYNKSEEDKRVTRVLHN